MCEWKKLAIAFGRIVKRALPIGAGILAWASVGAPRATADGIDPPPGAPLNGKDLTVEITENATEGIKSVKVNGKVVTQNMDGSWSIGPLGSIQTGTVNVTGVNDLVTLSDMITLANGNATIVIPKDGFESDSDLGTEPSADTEKAPIKNGTATATYTIITPAEKVPEPASIALLGVGITALGMVYRRRNR
jgi:hypothetical protein